MESFMIESIDPGLWWWLLLPIGLAVIGMMVGATVDDYDVIGASAVVGMLITFMGALCFYFAYIDIRDQHISTGLGGIGYSSIVAGGPGDYLAKNSDGDIVPIVVASGTKTNEYLVYQLKD